MLTGINKAIGSHFATVENTIYQLTKKIKLNIDLQLCAIYFIEYPQRIYI